MAWCTVKVEETNLQCGIRCPNDKGFCKDHSMLRPVGGYEQEKDILEKIEVEKDGEKSRYQGDLEQGENVFGAREEEAQDEQPTQTNDLAEADEPAQVENSA